MVSPNDPVVQPSPLVSELRTLLEANRVPSWINDSIVAIVEGWTEMKTEKGVFVLVGHNPETNEVVINLDRHRTGHITFSPRQARDLARLLNERADELEKQDPDIPF